MCNSDKQFKIKPRQGNTALHSGLAFINNQAEWENIIVGWTGVIKHSKTEVPDKSHGIDKDISPELKPQLETKLNAQSEYGSIHAVWLPGNDQRWQAYAKLIIWPILHYIQSEPIDGHLEKKWWSDYVKMNEAYAEKILEIYQPGDLVWVHDYPLFLLPQILRMKQAKTPIGLFMHSPFPSSEYFRCLAKRKELLEGILGANVVATQSYSFSRHFISSCARLLGVEIAPKYVSAFGIHVTVDTIPVGINVETVEQEAFHETVGEKVLKLRELYRGIKIIVGRERLDSVRGVIQKLHAFEMFLDLYPEWQGRVVLIQVTSPAEFKKATSGNVATVSELVENINSKHGGLSLRPVQLFSQEMTRSEYLALLRVADMGLITCERDGLNTASLEFIVCQKNNHAPLVLSEFTGTASTLVDAIQVNPWDSVAVAHTIYQGLSHQDADSNARVSWKLYETVQANTVQHWVWRCLSLLVRNVEHHDQTRMTPALDCELLLRSYSNPANKKRLLIFDYDGTLTPIVRDPAAAIPSVRLKRTLQTLCRDPRNTVWIISGRDGAFLDKWLGDLTNIGFSAEHGCFIKPASKTLTANNVKWTNLAEQVDMTWQQDVQQVFDYYTDRTQGATIETKRAALTWHYRRADPEFGSFQAKSCREHLLQLVALKNYELEVMDGKANVEVRPRQFNKGEIVKSITKAEQPQFIMCLGDDSADEDMFKALQSQDHELLNSATATATATTNKNTTTTTTTTTGSTPPEGTFTIKVGSGHKWTEAAWHLIDPAAVLDTLLILSGEMGPSEMA